MPPTAQLDLDSLDVLPGENSDVSWKSTSYGTGFPGVQEFSCILVAGLIRLFLALNTLLAQALFKSIISDVVAPL